MATNYDDVIAKHRKYLTHAQISALAKASEEYGLLNAGKRAEALLSAREQFDAGQRGLQNMGLSGAADAPATSGEVPRLVQKIQTPFDQYNRRLQDVENRQLASLGAAFAANTKRAMDEARKKREEELANRHAPSEYDKPQQWEEHRIKATDRGLLDHRQEMKEPAATPKVSTDDGSPTKEQQERRKRYFSALAAAKATRMPIPDLPGEMKRAKVESEVKSDIVKQATDPTARRLPPTLGMDPTRRAGIREAQSVVDKLTADKSAGKPVSDSEYKKALADVDIAKLTAENPWMAELFEDPGTAEKGYSNVSEPGALGGGGSYYEGLKSAATAETEKNTAKKKEIDAALKNQREQYQHYKSLLDVIDSDGGYKEDKDRALASIKASPLTVDQARQFVSKYEELQRWAPETTANDSLYYADLQRNDPDAYKALQVYPYLSQIKERYPDLASWVEGKVADYNMQQHGFRMPTMSAEKYEENKANIKGIKAALKAVQNAQYAYDNAGAPEAEDVVSDKDHAAAALAEAKAALKNKYGMSVQDAEKFVEAFERERDVRSEYNYYRPGMVAQLEHSGEKPTKPVNQREADGVYRLVNGLVTNPNTHSFGGIDVSAHEYISKDQRDAYNAIYERNGIEAANEFYKNIIPYLNIQRAAADEAYYKKFADEHPFWADLRSIVANLVWNVPASVENISKGIQGRFTEERPYYDVNSSASFRSGRADIIRSERSQNILQNMDRPDWANKALNFAYNTGMSIGDSAAVMALAYLGAPPAVTSVVFGSSAGNQAYKDAMERGATQDQALSYAIVNGVAEALFEEVSLEKVMTMDFTGRGALIKNLLSQSFVEGSEELATGVADLLGDLWVMQDKSQYNLAKKQYIAQGMTEYQAERQAFLDQVKDVGMDALGGFISGAAFAGGGAVLSSAQHKVAGKKLREGNSATMDRYTRAAQILGGKSMDALQQYQAEQTDTNAGKLKAAVDDTFRDLFGNGEMDIPDVSNASSIANAKQNPLRADAALDVDAAKNERVIDRATAGAAMLSGDKMNTTLAKTIMDVLGDGYLRGQGYDVSSPQAFSNDYNARLDKYGIKPYAEVQTAATPKLSPQTGTLADARLRKADQAFRAESPSSEGGILAGKALQQRQQNRQQVDLKAKENAAANRVWKNPNQGYTTTADGKQVMSLPGNMTAVARAEYERKNFKAHTTAKMDGVTMELSGMEARKGLTDAQVFAEAKKAMTKDAAQKLDVYMKLSKALSLPMVIRDVVAGTSGYVHDGKLYVTLSGQQSIPRVVAHELTHFMQQHASEKYDALRTHLVADVGGKAEFEKLMREKAGRYGLDLSNEAERMEADDEVCAELCERMLSDTEALERFAEKNVGAATTLRDRLLKILNAVKAALKDVKNRDFGNSKSDLITQEETIEAWYDGISEAIKNANERSQTNEGRIAQTAGVTTSDQNSLIRDVKNAKTDEDIDKAFANHSVDIIEYDMEGYRQDLVDSKLMAADELESLFDTMRKAIDKVKLHRSILDYGAQLDSEAEILEAKQNRAYLPYKQNADPHYKLALDFSTLCRKRVLLGSIQEILQKKLKRSLTPAETIAIRRELLQLKADGEKIEVACALCYVEAARLKSHKVIDEFLGVDLNQAERTKHTAEEMKNFYAQNVSDLRNTVKQKTDQWKRDTISDDWWAEHGNHEKKTGNLKDKSSATKAQIKAYGISIGDAKLKEKYEAFSKKKRIESKVSADQDVMIKHAQDLVNDKNVTINGVEFPGVETFLSTEWLAKLKMAAPDIFYAFINKVRSATRSKAQETDTFYSRGDISMVPDAVLKYANDESGFRHQSWSDFVPTHLLDTMAAVIEMSIKQAKMHAYTKVPAMVELLGRTGMMLNMSLIPDGKTGIDRSGNLIWDSYEGMNYDTMLYLRDMFPNTAGNIAIGISDEQIQKLLQSNDIDYVIPYHASGMNQQMRGHMGLKGWLEYTSSQNESEVDDPAVKKRHKDKKQKPPALKEWFSESDAKAAGKNGYEYMRQAAQKYLDICKKDGWIPKFSQYIEEKNGQYVPKAGYENYWKLLIDRKMVNHLTGEVILQQAVKPTFDQDTVLRILDDAVADPANAAKERAIKSVSEKLSNEWVAEKENANLEDKAEKKRFNELTSVLAAARAKEDVENRRRIQELREQNSTKSDDIRNSIDEDFLSDGAIEDQLSNVDVLPGTRFALDTDGVARKPGYKPKGKAPRARDIDVPEVAKNGKRVSDFTRSFLESNKVTNEIADELIDKVESGEWGGYTRLTNEEAMNRAKDYIAKHQVVKAQQDFHDMVMSGQYNVNTRALGLQLLTEAAQRGDKAALLDIASDLRVLATDAGQSVQIFSVLKDLGGVGSSWYLQKVVERMNNKYADQIASGKMNEITVPQELYDQLEQAKTTPEVTAAEAVIAKNIADQLPLTWTDRLSNWRYMAMLANPTTHVRNLFGNLLMGAMNTTKDVVAAGIERIGIRDQSKRTHAVLTVADRQAMNGFADQAYADNEGLLRQNGKFSFENEIRQNMRSFDTKALNAVAQTNFNLLEKEDMWFIKPAFKSAFMQYLKAQGYTMQGGVAGKTLNGEFKAMTNAQQAQAVEYAAEQAWKATFHDASALATMLNKISGMNKVSRLIVEGVMPFKKTPINIAKRGIEYSLAGIVKGLVQLGRDVRNGKATTSQAIDNLASGITGTALMAVGLFLSKAGLIRVGDDDDKKLSTYLSDTGDQTYSLKLGKYSFALSALAPATIPLFMGAALNEMVNKSGGELDLSTVTNTISGTLNPFMEMSFMSSLNSALKNYGSEGIGGALGNSILTSAENYFSQYLPTVVGKVGQFADPTVRTTKSSATSPIGSGMDYYVRSLAKKIPGVEATLQPDVNVWGRTTKKDTFQEWALDFANKFILPANVKISNRDAVDDELIRVVETTGETSFLPSDGAKKFKYMGEDYKMTAEQYTEFSKDRGIASYAALKEVIASDAYQSAPDNERATMLENALKAAQKQVNTIWKEKLGAYDPNPAPVQQTEVKATEGDYTDPALYKVAASYPTAYDKAAKAKAKGISPDTFLSIYEARDQYNGENQSRFTREQIMASNLTVKQKEFMDDLLVSDKGRNPDYSSPAWFEISMLGKSQYEEAKLGEKVGLKPETYLTVYKQWKSIDAKDKNGKTVYGLKKKRAKEYIDSLPISAPVYDYIWTAVFGY